MLSFCCCLIVMKKNLSFSHFELQVLMTGLFTVLVPLDHILMLTVRNNGIFESLNYEDGGLRISYNILRVVLAFYLFLIGLILGKLCSKKKLRLRGEIFNLIRLRKKIDLIPIWVFIILLSTYLFYYISNDLIYLFSNIELSSGSTKQIRLSISETGSLSYKLFAFSANVFFALNILLLMSQRSPLRWVAFVMIFALSIYRGDRGDIVLALISLCVFQNYDRPNLFKLGLWITVLVVFFTSFKPIYNFVFEQITGASTAPLSSYNFGFYFSRIETLSAFEISNYVLSKYDQAYQLGQSYWSAPLTFIPRFIADFSDLRISRVYKETIAPGQDGYFGFSPIAEAYINFGWFGILIVGFIFSFTYCTLVFKKFSIANLLSFFFIFRFFRSDFASSFKMNYLVYGFAMILSYFIVRFICVIFNGRRKKQHFE